MKLPLVVAVALLWQSSLLVNIGAVARPEHMRYQRVLRVPSGRRGIACTALDATVLAHTASPAHSDLRLFRVFRDGAGTGETEVPYTLTESGPEPLASAPAPAEHVAVHGNTLAFDLRMPPRAYSEVRLGLGLRNFVATATAEGRDRQGKHALLGSVPVFDLSAQSLGRWTMLLLEESSWPILHVSLAVRTPEGAPITDLAPAMVQDAAVPPSRTRQTVFVPVAKTRQITQRGARGHAGAPGSLGSFGSVESLSVALLRVPAHVPVERVRFTFAPGPKENFSREVTVSARADGAPVTDTEATDAGPIAHVSLPSGDPGVYPIALREDAVNATLGATLVRPATVLVAVDNGEQTPLPIQSVALEMRERKLCFAASPDSRYTLRYGDAALSDPSYDARTPTLPEQVLDAVLGPEERNPHFVPRRDARPLLGRHPELFWLLVLLCAGMMGGTALGYVQQRRS